MKKQHINLIIATPGHSVQAGYLKSLLATISKLAEEKITWGYTSEFSSHVAVAREMTLNGPGQMDLGVREPFAGQFTYDKILWIDSDITFTPEDVLRAYKSDFDIVSGAYLLANGEAMVFTEKMGAPMKYQEVLECKEPVKLMGAGMGFMAVKSGVFESMSRPWFQTAIVKHDFNNGNGEVEIQISGEDLSFCQRAIENGFELWLDPEIKLIHSKTMRLTWDGPMP
jgi:hypothetical protein